MTWRVQSPSDPTRWIEWVDGEWTADPLTSAMLEIGVVYLLSPTGPPSTDISTESGLFAAAMRVIGDGIPSGTPPPPPPPPPVPDGAIA